MQQPIGTSHTLETILEAKSEKRSRTVYYLSKDPETAKEVGAHLAEYGIRVETFATVADLAHALRWPSGTVLVLDMQAVPDADGIAALVGRCERLLGERPILVCIAHSKEMGLRLQAVRVGAQAFFVAPVVVDELAGRLLELSGGDTTVPYRVLVVDDQPVAALFAARTLENAGMETRVVGDPLLFLEALEAFGPDLVLMDLHMPGASGIELTSILRDHEKFFSTPVVFLSGELDADVQLDALRVGGDDFIAKPVPAERLVTAVQSRIQAARSRNRRGAPLPGRDHVTGLLNRQSFLRRLGESLADESSGLPGSGVILIDLDFPAEQVGSEQFHRLLAMLGEVLRGHLEPQDFAARYGGHRFALSARRADVAGLQRLAETLREDIAEKIASEGTGDVVAVSIGISLFQPRAKDAHTLVSRAEKACTTARAGGDGRVMTYAPKAAGSDPRRDDDLIALIEEAIRADDVELLFQPIVALRQLPGERYEVLLRLRSGDEHASSGDLLAVARRSGLMRRIDQWVLAHALEVMQHQRDAHQGLRLFVPQTMVSVGRKEWVERLRTQIISRDLVERRPVLQLKLQDVAENIDGVASRFDELKRLGIKICVDDFPDEQAALQLVARLPISLVRLPRETFGAMETARLTTLVQRLHRSGCSVIACGIEHPQTIARIWKGGVDFIQGDFLQLPDPDLGFDFHEALLP